MCGCRRGATIRGMSDANDWSSDLPEVCCLKCHFFIRHPQAFGPGWNHSRPLAYKEIVTDVGRREVVNHVFEKFLDSDMTEFTFCYGCDNDVWDSEGLDADQAGVGALVLAEATRARGRGCFYYAHADGTSLAAAKELERRKVARREARDDRKVTRKQGKAGRAVALRIAREDQAAFSEEAKKNRKPIYWALGVSALMLIVAVAGVVVTVIALALTFGPDSLKFWQASPPVVKASAPDKPAAAPTSPPAPTTPPAKALPKK